MYMACHRIVADAQVLRDLAVVEPRTEPERNDLLVGPTERLSPVEQALDPFLADHSLLL